MPKRLIGPIPPRLLTLMAGAVLLLLAGMAPPASAATVQIGQAPCTLILTGQIGAGDYDKLAAFKGDALFWRDAGLDPDPVLCLDSKGGSLTEGARIARFVYEQGVQTRVGDGDICHSVCAIIFMMGNKHAGPTSVEENRILHVGGELAFHSPSIAIDNTRGYNGEQLERAYQLGLESILNIINLANSQRPFESGAMMHPGLLRALLDTAASDLFHITTIEQALSWDIGLEGVPDHLPQFSIQRQMVCENGLMRGFRRPSEIYDQSDNTFMTDAVFRLDPISRSGAYRLIPDYGTEELEEGIVYGFRYWALPMECRVTIETGAVKVCGTDSNFGHSVGDCFSDYLLPLPDYARYHPLTEFKALQGSGIAADVLRSARCSIRSTGGAVLREEPCKQAIDIFERADRKYARHTLHWSNGERTEIEIATDPGFGVDNWQDIYRVNGAEAVPQDDAGACLRVRGQDNVVCATAP